MSAQPTTPEQSHPDGALPIGSRLGEFEIRRVLGIGGFGIVYLAFDHQLEREVAVKEYMPASLAGRTATYHVSLLSQSNAETFALGLRSFINEARLLARFDHPSLVKVYRFWEEHSTAYMAMALYRGRTVKSARLEMLEQPSEAWIRTVLEPLLDAIERLHREDVYHRDIAPDNILIEPDGHPVLLDFGAARRVIGDKSQNLTAILKPSYAPIEQYGEPGSVKQGPWTDIYALGATIHFLLLGRPPMQATARIIQDDSQPLATMPLTDCSTNFLQLIDWMLAPRPAERPQNVAAVRKVLAGELTPPVSSQVTIQSAPGAWERTLPITSDVTKTLVTGQRTVQQDKTIFEPLAPTASTGGSAATSNTGSAATTTALPLLHGPGGDKPQAKPKPWLIPVVALAAVVLAAGAWFGLRGPSTSTSPDKAVSSVPPVAAPAQATNPPTTTTGAAPAAAPVATPPISPTVAAVPSPEVKTTPAPTASPQAPTTAARASAAATATATATKAPAVAAAVPRSTTTAPAGQGSTKPAQLAAAPAPQPAPAGIAAEPAGATAQSPSPRVATPPAEAPAPKPTQTAEADAPLSPSESCRKQVSVLKWMCMDVQCGKARYQQHPECLKLRADQEKEKARAANR